jgi:hypothetical protein
MRFFAFIFLLYALMLAAWSQDESALRNTLTGAKSSLEEKNYSWLLSSRSFEIDINEDGTSEKLLFQKRDAEDWFVVSNPYGTTLFEAKLDPLGRDSRIYKITLVKVSPTVRTLIIHYYVGLTKYLNLESNARLYFITVQNGDLRKTSFFRADYCWEEVSRPTDHYHRRSYDLKIADYDSDGVKEIALVNRSMTRIYSYRGNGVWFAF